LQNKKKRTLSLKSEICKSFPVYEKREDQRLSKSGQFSERVFEVVTIEVTIISRISNMMPWYFASLYKK
jgi:hypothetical protein